MDEEAIGRRDTTVQYAARMGRYVILIEVTEIDDELLASGYFMGLWI